MPTPPKVAVSVGGAILDEGLIMAVILGGVNMFRIQQAKFSKEESLVYAKKVKEIAHERGRSVEVLFDYSGERERIGVLDKEILVQSGDIVRFIRAEKGSSKDNLPLPISEEAWKQLKVDQRLYIADGAVQTRIRDIGAKDLSAVVEVVSAPIKTDDDVNFPDSNITVDPLSARERNDLPTLQASGLVDWISLSFIEDPQSVIDAKKLVGSIKVMSKIESLHGVDNIDEICAVSDGVMVARGDLAIQAPMERLGIYERKIVKSARAAGKPVMLATQFLESMVKNPIPLRAELSDLSTAALLGVDYILLTKEIAVGQYPLRALAIAKGTLAYTAEHLQEV